LQKKQDRQRQLEEEEASLKSGGNKASQKVCLISGISEQK